MKSLLTLLLTGFLLTGPARANAAVEVRGLGSSSGPTVQVQIYADLGATRILSYSCRLFYDPGILVVREVIRNDAVWYLSDGNQPLPYVPPDVSAPGEVEFIGAKLDGGDPLAGVTGNDVLLGIVRFERITPDTPSFGLSIGREGAYASFVTHHGIVLEARPGEVSFNGVEAAPHDRDLDGLTDQWEADFFGHPRFAFYSDDPDGDGDNNLAEEGFGTDPTDRRSHLAFTLRRIGPRRIRLEWTSTPGRFYALLGSQDLATFQPVKTGIKATPPLNTEEFVVPNAADATFFKLMLESAPTP